MKGGKRPHTPVKDLSILFSLFYSLIHSFCHDFRDQREKTTSQFSLKMKGKDAFLSYSFRIAFCTFSFLDRCLIQAPKCCRGHSDGVRIERKVAHPMDDGLAQNCRKHFVLGIEGRMAATSPPIDTHPRRWQYLPILHAR